MESIGKKAARFAYDAITYYLVEQALQKPFYVIKQAEGGTSIDPACKSTNFSMAENIVFALRKYCFLP